MSLTNVTDWMNEFGTNDSIWYIKRLSGNDTLATGAHQAGPYIPKQILFRVFPEINQPKAKNPDTKFDLYIDSHSDHKLVRAVWYNNRLRGRTRNEARLTGLGGSSSALLDPESTGALTIFAFTGIEGEAASECHVWICRNNVEEDLVEERLGPVEPGKHGWRLWSPDSATRAELWRNGRHRRQNCRLAAQDLPSGWLERFPSGRDIVNKAIDLRPEHGLDPDNRLIKRRQCETELFHSIEEATIMPIIEQGIQTIEDFINHAQTVLQRRKVRAGRSLELHVKEILVEENICEGKQFSYQPQSEPGKRPDFLFPSECAYQDPDFPSSRLRMLAVKTSCRDRWRQILNEAQRIDRKHLLTIQPGVSEKQFREMTNAGVQLVVPEPLRRHFPSSVQPHLQNLESFIADVRLLGF